MFLYTGIVFASAKREDCPFLTIRSLNPRDLDRHFRSILLRRRALALLDGLPSSRAWREGKGEGSKREVRDVAPDRSRLRIFGMAGMAVATGPTTERREEPFGAPPPAPTSRAHRAHMKASRFLPDALDRLMEGKT